MKESFRNILRDPGLFDFDFDEWKTPVLNPQTQCRDMGTFYFKERADSEAIPGRANVFRFLHRVTSLMLEPVSFPKVGLKPPGDPEKSCQPSDLARELALELVDRCSTVKFHPLRARLLDFCLLKLGRRQQQAVRDAIDAYLQGVESYDEPHWEIKALQRSFQLAKQFKLSTELDRVKDSVAFRLHGSCDAYRILNHRLNLLEGLFELGWEPLDELLQLVDVEIENARDASPHAKKNLLLLRQRIEQKPASGGSPEAVRKTLIELAALMVGEASKQKSAFLKSHRLKEALNYTIEAGDKELEDSCIRALSSVQQRMVEEEMKEYSGEISVVGFHARVEEFIIHPSRSWQEAHVRLAIYMLSNLPIEDNLATLAANAAGKTPYRLLATEWLVNQDGEVVAFAEGGSFDPAIRQHAAGHFGLIANLLAWTQYRLLGKLGPLQFADIKRLVNGVCSERYPHRRTVARGLYRGWGGDWMSSMALLIPAFENTIRLDLVRCGCVPFKVKREELQEKYLLHQLVDKFADRFQPQYLFAIKFLLLRHGYNLRNLHSHGLIPDEPYPWQPSIVTWGLFLLTLFHPRAGCLIGDPEVVATHK